MNVSQSHWENTRVGGIVTSFPGVMNSFLLDATGPELIRAQSLLPIILWRWYHLVNLQLYDNSPANICEMIREGEDWPENGMFYPTATLDMGLVGGIPKSTVTISLDYISFAKIPILEDILLSLKGKKITRTLGPLYHTLIDTTTQGYEKSPPPVSNSESIFLLYINTVFIYSYVTCNQEDIKSAYTLAEWMDYWHEFIFERIPASQENGVEINLLDSFILDTRKSIPGFGADMNDLENLDLNDEIVLDKNIIQYFYTGTHIADMILIPLSLYAPIIRPTFLDQNLFDNDVRKSLDKYTNGEELSAPSGGGVALTPLGYYFREFLNKL